MADRDFLSTKLAFELSRLDLVASLNDLEAASQLTLLDELSRATHAQLAYFEQGAARAREAQQLLDELQPAAHAQRDAAAEERAAHAATREHLEGTSHRALSMGHAKLSLTRARAESQSGGGAVPALAGGLASMA